MTKQLTTQNATITTAAVQVKTLTISGKQVTLAVFRQLREEPLIAENGTLNGVPWGIVNYHPDKCEAATLKHHHIVWQRGDDLLRCRVNERPSFDIWGSDDYEFAPDVADAYVEASVREWLHGRIDEPPLKAAKRGVGFSDQRKFTYPHLTVTAFIAGTSVKAANARTDLEKARGYLANAANEEWAQKRVANAEDEARSTLAALDAEIDSWNTTIDELKADFNAAVGAEVERRQRHRDIRVTLTELPQLFIAV
jgi:hypothetical protein